MGCRVQGAECRMQGAVFRVEGRGLRVQVSWVQVLRGHSHQALSHRMYQLV